MNLTLHALNLDDQTFEKIVKANPEWNFEQTAGGELVVVPPTGGTSGNKNSNLSYQLEGWNLARDAGRTFVRIQVGGIDKENRRGRVSQS